uniref:Uncharacterized protein n=1 Tax=Peronospora matthiolae TaxID=2874970 RepID=A0AAV1V6N3_9STRA
MKTPAITMAVALLAAGTDDISSYSAVGFPTTMEHSNTIAIDTNDLVTHHETDDNNPSDEEASKILLGPSRSRWTNQFIQVPSDGTWERSDMNDATTPPTYASAVPPPADYYLVGVERDATYRIQGPICSGFGPQPTGSCPAMGEKAASHCDASMASYKEGTCVLPVNSTCQPLKTGAWGCVLFTVDNSSPTTPSSKEPVMTAQTFVSI